MSTYLDDCKAACKLCAEGVWLTDASHRHWKPELYEGHAPKRFPCTAPDLLAWGEGKALALESSERALKSYVADNGELTKRLASLEAELRAATDRAITAEHTLRVATERAEKAESERDNWSRLADGRDRCMHCGGPETTDKDCMCGGTGKRAIQVRGLEGCIQYWRKLHSELTVERDALRQRVNDLESKGFSGNA